MTDGSGQGSWTRDFIMRVGKDLRPTINAFIGRYSEVGDAPILDEAHFPWTARLTADWLAIRKEAEQILEYRKLLPRVSTLSPDHRRISDGVWKSLFLYGYGIRADAACARCPETVRLLEHVPNLESAFFSILEPGDHLIKHRGPTRSLINCHLALIVPKHAEDCQIRLNKELYRWEEGKFLIFDDTYKHEVWNMTDDVRVVLFIHVRRPVRFPGSIVSAAFLQAIKWSPFVRDAKRNLEAWSAEFESAARESSWSSEDKPDSPTRVV